MDSCEEALSAFARRQYGDWKGLPACTLAQLTASFPLLNQGIGTGRLFDRPAEYRMVTVEGYPRPVRAWFSGDRLALLDAEYPDASKTLAADFERLGEPELKLDSHWDIHLLAQGEWIWASRGLSALVNPGNRVVLRIRAFAPVSLEQYQKYLRIESRSIEFREF
jgi:hypothetical protein